MLEKNEISAQKEELLAENARLLVALHDSQKELLKSNEDVTLLRSQLGAKDASVSGMTKVPCLMCQKTVFRTVADIK